MGKLYDRALTLTVNGTTLVQQAGNPDQSLRVKFEIEQTTLQSPNKALIWVYNLSDAHATALASMQPYGPVTLSAGYTGGSGLIFSGDLKQARKGRENPTDTFVAFSAADGLQAYKHSVTVQSLAPGSTPLDHLNTFVSSFAKYGVSLGYAPTALLTKFKYPRAVAFAGDTKEYMRTLALSNQCSWSILNGKVEMVPAGSNVPSGPVTLNSATGMIGMPEQTVEGVFVRSLINPAILVNRLVQIDQADIQQAQLFIDRGGGIENPQNAALPSLAADGVYSVYSIKMSGDTRANPWFMDCFCLPANQSPSGPVPQKALNSPYYSPN